MLESPVSLQALFVVLAASTLMAIVPAVFRRFALPTSVAEIVAGILIGPTVLGWAQPDDPVVRVLGTFGLAYLLFVAGLELDLRVLVHPRLARLLGAYALTLAMALGGCLLLQRAGLIESPLLVAITLSASALGVLTPILKDRGLLRTGFGQVVLSACVIAEVLPITLLSTFYASDHETPLLQISRVLGIGVLAGMLAAALIWATCTRWAVERLALQERPTLQLRVRQTMLILIGLVVAAHGAGVEIILGALAAGVVVATTCKRDPTTETYYGKIEAMGFGMFIPVFFVSIGLCFDVGSLTSSTTAMMKVPLYLGLLLLVRGLPAALVYRGMLPGRACVAAGFYQATNLAFIAAAVATGLRLGKLQSADATALITAGMLSVILYPQVGTALLQRIDPAK